MLRKDQVTSQWMWVKVACELLVIRMEVWAAILPSGELRSLKSSGMMHKGSSSHCDCFSLKWRSWKCHLQSLVLTVILFCLYVCYQVNRVPQQHGLSSWRLDLCKGILKVPCAWVDCALWNSPDHPYGWTVLGITLMYPHISQISPTL